MLRGLDRRAVIASLAQGALLPVAADHELVEVYRQHASFESERGGREASRGGYQRQLVYPPVQPAP